MRYRTYKVGDLVTRDGTDVHEVIVSDPGDGAMTVRCVKAPESRWIEVGETESNLTGRYSPIDARGQGK